MEFQFKMLETRLLLFINIRILHNYIHKKVKPEVEYGSKKPNYFHSIALKKMDSISEKKKKRIRTRIKFERVLILNRGVSGYI